MFIRRLTAAFTLITITCFANVACSSTKSEPRPEVLAEQALASSKGAVALVFNDEGQPIAVARDGKVIPACQICTPELQKKYGQKCERARKASDFLKADAKDDKPLICDKLMSTDVQAVNPVTVLKHTGSQCMTFLMYIGTAPVVYQYCW